jgi:hypothetical protein
MNLHEYQGKQLFAQYGLPVSKGYACDTPEEVAAKLKEIGGTEWVVKAQVHAGGRGKAGGVKLVKSAEEAAEFAKKWLGQRLVTYQTDERVSRFRRFWLSPVPISPRSCILAPCLIVPAVVSSSWRLPKVAWKSRRWPTTRRKKFSRLRLIRWSVHSLIRPVRLASSWA